MQYTTEVVKTLTIGVVTGAPFNEGITLSTDHYPVEEIDRVVDAFNDWQKQAQDAMEAAEKWLDPSELDITVDPVIVRNNEGDTTLIDVNEIMKANVPLSLSATVRVVGLDIASAS